MIGRLQIAGAVLAVFAVSMTGAYWKGRADGAAAARAKIEAQALRETVTFVRASAGAIFDAWKTSNAEAAAMAAAQAEDWKELENALDRYQQDLARERARFAAAQRADTSGVRPGDLVVPGSGARALERLRGLYGEANTYGLGGGQGEWDPAVPGRLPGDRSDDAGPVAPGGARRRTA